MMIMERTLLIELEKWKNSKNRKPLILKGARQVGKTWLMREFGNRAFKKVAYISFFNNKRMKNVFDADYDLERILLNISIETKLKITAEDTLIIFDEIQEAPKALEALKFFCENAPEYPVVAAGSLLGVAIHEGVSFPVGKVDTLNVYPLSFMEFLRAMGEEALADLLSVGNVELVEDFRDKYIFWLKNYYYIGGMPEVVAAFKDSKDYLEVRHLQKSLLQQYEDDLGKHAIDELGRLRLVWNSIPLQLSKENKKFFFGQIKTGARLKDFELAIEWLKDCGLITKVYKVNKPAMPLKAYVDFSAFKLFTLDVGLLGAMSDLDAVSILEGNKIFTEFKGALTEQYVLQQLVATTGYTPYYFLLEKGAYEMDFMVQKGSDIVPLEVKSEDNLRAKSLQAYCKKYSPNYAVRTSMSGYRVQENMLNLPLYLINRL